MFTTYESGRNILLSEFSGRDVNCWEFVTLDYWISWFLVTVNTVEDDGASWSSTMCLQQIQQIEELIKNTQKIVVRVQMLNPTKKHPKGWRLRDVDVIHKLSTDALEGNQYEVVTMSGRTASYPLRDERSGYDKNVEKHVLWKKQSSLK